MKGTTEVDSTINESTEDIDISNSDTKVDLVAIKGSWRGQKEAFGLQEKSTMM